VYVVMTFYNVLLSTS